jgi:hypothetical protein
MSRANWSDYLYLDILLYLQLNIFAKLECSKKEVVPQLAANSLCADFVLTMPLCGSSSKPTFGRRPVRAGLLSKYQRPSLNSSGTGTTKGCGLRRRRLR